VNANELNANELNALYTTSCDAIMPYLRLEGAEQCDVDSEQGKESLRKGIEGLQTVLRFSPASWNAGWMLGKAQQALQQHEQAYQSFLTAHRNILTNQNVMRELALECLQTKRFTQAVHYCHVAMEFDPEDYSLWPNMAVAQLFNGKLDEAEQWANKALAKIPGDEPATTVLAIVADVRAGKRSIPTDFSLVQRGEQ
jgi:tetratricopeptide (TPR) repeat protein